MLEGMNRHYYLLVISSLFGAFGSARAVGAAETPQRESKTKLVENARTVLDALVKSAEENRRLPERDAPGASAPFHRTGDDLTVYYVRAAATAARQLPEHEGASAFLLALGIGLDETSLLRSNPISGGLWRKVEPEEARKRRVAVLGSPTLHGRHDLAQHFSVSAGLTAALGAPAAESAGLLKEMLDARGGSGFSFADLSADYAGIAFARRLLDKPSRLADVERRFRIGDYAISPRGLPEGLNAEQFEKRYGSLQDDRFKRLQADIRKRIDGLPGYCDTDKK